MLGEGISLARFSKAILDLEIRGVLLYYANMYSLPRQLPEDDGERPPIMADLQAIEY